MGTIWKTILETGKSYEVSNQGEVRSYLKRNSTELYKEPSIVKQYDLNTHCKTYKRINLRKDAKSLARYVHRLVAQAFIPNPYNKPQVNHIDGDPFNNCLSNLEWVNNSENQRHWRGHKSGVENIYIYKNRVNYRVQVRHLNIDKCFTAFIKAKEFRDSIPNL